jgi:hypothetical protein
MKIIFLNDKKLAQNLREGEVGESEKLFYLLFILVFLPFFETLDKAFLSLVNDSSSSASNNTLNIYNFVLGVLPHIIIAYALIVSYRINTQNSGKNFIEKVICLSCPLVIKMTLLSFLIGTIVNSVFGLMDGLKVTNNLLETNVDIYFIEILVSAYFFIKIQSNIKLTLS